MNVTKGFAKERFRASKVVNRAIELNGLAFNPSLNAILRFGDIIDLTPQSRSILDEGALIHEELYHRAVLPELSDLAKFLLRDSSTGFDIKNGRNFSIQELREIYLREILNPANKLVNRNGEIRVISDELTLNCLKGRSPLPRSNYGQGVTFHDNTRHGCVDSYRLKAISQISGKQKRRIIKVFEQGLESKLYDLIKFVCYEMYDDFWKGDNRVSLMRKYPEQVIETHCGDNLGFRRLIVNYERAKRRYNWVLGNKRNLDTKRFEIKIVEDHRERTQELRPGGIHLIYTSRAFNLPLEIQLTDLESEIYDKFGPNAHWRYSAKGKK